MEFSLLNTKCKQSVLSDRVNLKIALTWLANMASSWICLVAKKKKKKKFNSWWSVTENQSLKLDYNYG